VLTHCVSRARMRMRGRCLLKLVLMLSAVLALSGCGNSGRVGVTGQVKRKDGSPLVGARVTFRSPGTGKTASGFTDENGNYVLGTSTPGEGLLPDGYYVTVIEDRGPLENRKPPTVSDKYTRPDTSGLLCKVEPGGSTTFNIVLDPP
jgi:Carboxypeptidase regulatory-like domain